MPGNSISRSTKSGASWAISASASLTSFCGQRVVPHPAQAAFESENNFPVIVDDKNFRLHNPSAIGNDWRF